MRNKSYFILFLGLLCGLDTIAQDLQDTSVYRESYTQKIDIIDTKLRLSFDWDSCFVFGEAHILLQPYAYSIRQVRLDARGFDIQKVDMAPYNENFHALQYNYDGKSLLIDLDREYQPSEQLRVYIKYTAKPNKLQVGNIIRTANDKGLYFIKTPKRTPQIWTQGETECNSNWFPTVNDPKEKMTQEITLVVDSGFVTLSNGNLVSSKKEGAKRIDVWRQTIQHSTYLTMIAVGKFKIIVDKWRDMEVSYYMEPEYAHNARLIFGNTPEMLEYFSTLLGVSFPWDKYSQVVVRDFVSGAMENTSASVFYEKMNMTLEDYDKNPREEIIAHELFHQWFGDLVTTESWSNLPLNESFATYGEYLWAEYKYGKIAAEALSVRDWTNYLLGEAKIGQKEVVRYHYSYCDEMFDVFSYQKGGRILHYLRQILGDDVFFKGVSHYLKRHAYKSVEIHDLRLAMEEVSGRDLNWFFNQWFLQKGHPKLHITTSYDSLSKKVVVKIAQQQLSEYPTYRLPMMVDLYDKTGKVSRHPIEMTASEQSFVLNSDIPSLVVVDAQYAIPAEKTETKTLQEYKFMYEYAPMLQDKIQAFRGIMLSKDAKDDDYKQLENWLFAEKSWYIRQHLVKQLLYLPRHLRKDFDKTLKKIATKDAKISVRELGNMVIKNWSTVKE